MPIRLPFVASSGGAGGNDCRVLALLTGVTTYAGIVLSTGGTYAKLDPGTEVFDSGGEYSAGRFTAGAERLVRVDLFFRYDYASSSGRYGIQLRLNGTVIDTDEPASPGAYGYVNRTWTLLLQAGDYFELWGTELGSGTSDTLVMPILTVRDVGAIPLNGGGAAVRRTHVLLRANSTAVSANTDTVVTLIATKINDCLSEFDGTNKWTATRNGTYSVCLGTAVSRSGTRTHDLKIRKNGTDIVATQNVPTGSSDTVGAKVSADLALLAGDYLQAIVRSNEACTIGTYGQRLVIMENVPAA